MRFEVRLVMIPPDVWHRWPKDRPLARLAEDASGCERRIRKGVNVSLERRRYTLLCEQIEALSRRALRDNKIKSTLVWGEGPRAESYLELIEILQGYPPRESGSSEESLVHDPTKARPFPHSAPRIRVIVPKPKERSVAKERPNIVAALRRLVAGFIRRLDNKSANGPTIAETAADLGLHVREVVEILEDAGRLRVTASLTPEHRLSQADLTILWARFPHEIATD